MESVPDLAVAGASSSAQTEGTMKMTAYSAKSLTNKHDLCDYKAATKGNLKTHLLTHQGVKAFPCDLCDYKAATKGTLKKHLLAHLPQAVKAFPCRCTVIYATSKLLQKVISRDTIGHIRE